MSKKSFNQKEASLLIEGGLKLGKSKTELLDELSEKYYGKNQLVRLIASTPSTQLKEKYKKANFVLLGSLGLTRIMH